MPMDVFVRPFQYSAMDLSVVPRIFNWFKEPVTLSKPVAKIRTYDPNRQLSLEYSTVDRRTSASTNLSFV